MLTPPWKKRKAERRLAVSRAICLRQYNIEVLAINPPLSNRKRVAINGNGNIRFYYPSRNNRSYLTTPMLAIRLRGAAPFNTMPYPGTIPARLSV